MRTGGPPVRLEGVDHLLAAAFGHRPVEERELDAQQLAQVGLEQRAHLGELGEDEGPFAGGGDLLEDLFQPGQLAGAVAVEARAVAQEVGGMVADLLELHHRARR